MPPRRDRQHPISADHAGLLRAIWDDPADDTPRLVFADYLEKLGTPEATARAVFIRGQIAGSKSHAAGNAERELVIELGPRKGFVWTGPRVLLFRPWARTTEPDAVERMRELTARHNTVLVHSRPHWSIGGPTVRWHRGFPVTWTSFNVWNLKNAFRWLPVAEFAGMGKPGNPYPDNPDVLRFYPTCRALNYRDDSDSRPSGSWAWYPVPSYHPNRFSNFSDAMVPVFLGDAIAAEGGRDYRTAVFEELSGGIRFDSPTVAFEALSRAIAKYLYATARDALDACRGY